MKILEKIKDEVVKEFGYKSFEDFDDKSTFSYDHNTPIIINAIAIRFAKIAVYSVENFAKNKDVV